MTIARSTDPAPYIVNRATREEEDAVIAQAVAILHSRLRTPGQVFSDPTSVKAYLKLQLAEMQHEVFCVLYLDAQHQLIAFEETFRGTLTQTSVYPREVLKRALELSSAAVVFAHNHPSGVAEPSRADEHLTQQLKYALAYIDVRVLDHLIVGGRTVSSMAELGLI